MPIRFLCPACKVSIRAKDDRGGQTVRCPACDAPCVVPVPQGELIQEAPPPPPPPPPQFEAEPEQADADPFSFDAPRPRRRRAQPEYEDDDDEHYRRRLVRRSNAGPRAVSCGIFGAIVMAGVGLGLSQYFPVFGSLLERNIAEPWSPARMGLIPLHVLVFACLGAFFGGLAGYLSAGR